MSELNFRIATRLYNFWEKLQSREIRSRQVIVHFVGWLFTFILDLFIADLPFNLDFPVFLAHVYFWLRLAGLLHQKLQPSNELLIAASLLIFLLESAILNYAYSSSSLLGSAIPAPGFIITFIHLLLLAFLVLLISLILVHNSKGQRRVLLGFFLLGLIAVYLLEISGVFYLLLVEIILFIYLLRKTSWLEELTKVECWVYLFASLVLFRAFSKIDVFAGMQAGQFEQHFVWFLLPRFLYLTLFIYLLAVFVKIPIVLVYNFARLSRKLKISGLFQSTFPQVIQLGMLLIIFYFFMAGWQAEKVRKALMNQTDRIVSGEVRNETTVFQIPRSRSVIQLPGYLPLPISDDLPREGILKFTKQPTFEPFDSSPEDYFFFARSLEDGDALFHFIKLDSSFLQLVSDNTSILAGSALLAYSYVPPRWESYVYDLSFWKRDRRFRIFPFGLTPHRPPQTISVPITDEEQTLPDWLNRINQRLPRHNFLTVGRVIAPILNEDMRQSGFFAFDIILLPDVTYFTPTLLSYLLLLVVIYMLVNILVIRRMVKFGSEINQMIVQKFTQLKNGIGQISTGNLDYKVRLEGKDEFVELAERFNQMGERLKESIAEAREKERLEHELKIARQVQLDLLPRTLPQIPGFQVAATLKTANEVGGDFYDMLSLGENQYLFTIGDVSGKSTSAAFYMAQCISLIRFSPKFTSEPREIILRLNEYFGDPMVDRQIFVTAIVGMLDKTTSAMRFVRAGHTPPIFIPGRKAEKIQELEKNGLGIGLEKSGQLFAQNLEESYLALSKGDTVVFYTDGVVEASRNNVKLPGSNEKQFYGEERLQNLLQNLRGKSADEIMQAITDDVDFFYGGKSPVDDYTVLVIQRTDG